MCPIFQSSIEKFLADFQSIFNELLFLNIIADSFSTTIPVVVVKVICFHLSIQKIPNIFKLSFKKYFMLSRPLFTFMFFTKGHKKNVIQRIQCKNVFSHYSFTTYFLKKNCNFYIRVTSTNKIKKNIQQSLSRKFDFGITSMF